MTLPAHAAGDVDIREIKAGASRTLPPGDEVRDLILGEEDFLPRAEFLAKAETWVRLIRARAASFGWTEAVHRGQEKISGEIERHRILARVEGAADGR